jgi:hypothetical protein
MTVGKGKRPRDPNQLAKWLVDSSTSDEPLSGSSTPLPSAPSLSAYMAAMGRKGGQIGGKRRLLTMTPEARKAAAAKAAGVRWGKTEKKAD